MLPRRSHRPLLSNRLVVLMAALMVVVAAVVVVALERAETRSTRVSPGDYHNEHTAGRRRDTTNQVCRRLDTASSLCPCSSG